MTNLNLSRNAYVYEDMVIIDKRVVGGQPLIYSYIKSIIADPKKLGFWAKTKAVIGLSDTYDYCREHKCYYVARNEPFGFNFEICPFCFLVYTEQLTTEKFGV